MAKTVDIPSIGNVDFPDTMSNDEIEKAIRQLLAERTPVQQMLQQAAQARDVSAISPGGTGRQLGLTARAAITGATAPATMIADPLTALMNMMAGRTIAAPPSQTIQNLLTSAGLPQAETQQERISQDVAQALSGTGATAGAARLASQAVTSPVSREVLRILGTDPRAQAIAAGTGATAASMAREEGLGPLAQLGLGMIGSVAPGAAPVVGQNVAQRARQIVSPFTQEGREVIAGQVLQRSATNPEIARANLLKAQEIVPGSRPMTAEASMDPGLLALQNPVAKTLDVQNLIGQRISESNAARMRLLERLSGGGPEAIAAAEAKRTAVTSPMREAAFAKSLNEFGPVATTPITAAVDDVLAGATGNRQPVERAMAWLRGRIESAGNTPERIYNVRKDINDAISGALEKSDPGLRLAARELIAVRNVLDNVLESASPGFKNYLAQYARMSRPIDQMRILQEVKAGSTLAAPDVTTGMDIFSQAKLRQQLRSRAEELGQTLSESQAKQVDDLMRDLNRSASTTSAVAKRPGSDTFKNYSTANLIGAIFSDALADNTTLRTLARPLDFLYKLPDEQISRLMVEAMLDPKLAAQMMQKANIMSIKPVANQLRKKAKELGLAPFISAGME
jgi:hypothetical protein